MFGEIVLNLVTYSSVALVVWWIIEECSASPAAKILGRWTGTPLPQVRVKDVLFPLALAPLAVPALVRSESAKSARGQ